MFAAVRAEAEAPTVKHTPTVLCRLPAAVYPAPLLTQDTLLHSSGTCGEPVLSQVLLLIFFLEMQAIYYVYAKE